MKTAAFCLALFALGAMHPFHVGVFEFKHNERDQKLEVTCKIFIDDIELALKKETGELYDLTKNSKSEKVKKAVNDYLLRRITVAINKKNESLHFIGAEPEGDSMWCYYEINGVKRINSFSVKNTIFFELYNDQSNLVHLNYKNETRSLKLDSGNDKGILVY